NWYCNTVMPRRGLTRPRCKQYHTFINEDIETIKKICRHPNIQCRNGRMNCHAGVVRVTDCSLTGTPPKNCKYEGRGRSRRVVIACQDNPLLPVRLDS
ncbi:Ribonuclease 4, partial [Myotis davidii]